MLVVSGAGFFGPVRWDALAHEDRIRGLLPISSMEHLSHRPNGLIFFEGNGTGIQPLLLQSLE